MKSIILSSSGLKNITLSRPAEEDDFVLIFGEQELRLQNFLAEFISPVISHIRKSDPTIQSINFSDQIMDNKDDFFEFTKDIITSETISLIHQISRGYSIDINEYQAFKLRFFSIMIGNEELFNMINEAFPPDFSEENLNVYLKYMQCCYHFSQFSPDFDFALLVDNISENFYSIDQKEFLELPKRIQYIIISNPHLRIISEDSLLDIIYQIISNKTKEDGIDDINFLEQIEFTGLSENKLHLFLDDFDFNEMTGSLWMKLFQCFFNHFDTKPNRIKNRQYHIQQKTFEYIEDETNRFEGIIHHLTDECGGNVDEKGICEVTASTVHKNYVPRNAVNFSDQIHYASLCQPNAWLIYDFKDKKVHPTHYSIQTYGGVGSLKNWVIEGSNTKNDGDWKILDSQNDCISLKFSFSECTFKIDQINPDEYFRYLRIRVTGPNWKNKNFLSVSKLEYFGSVIYNAV